MELELDNESKEVWGLVAPFLGCSRSDAPHQPQTPFYLTVN